MRSLSAAGALLCLLGCSQSFSASDPTSFHQELAASWSMRLALKAGIADFEGSQFTLPPQPNYAAWAICGHKAIGWNEQYIERDYSYDGQSRMEELIPHYAAHEVCHILHRDNLPCGIDTPQKEQAANECGEELLRRE